MFWRKQKKEVLLTYPNPGQFKTWVQVVIRAFSLKEGTFTFVGVYGGLLLLIKGEGLVWLPYLKIKEILQKPELKDFTDQTITLGGIAVLTVAHGAILPFILAKNTVQNLYALYSDTPPKNVHTFLRSMTAEIVISPYSRKFLAGMGQDLPHNTNDFSDFVKFEVHAKFFDREKKIHEKIIGTVKKLFFGDSESIFIVPNSEDLQIFIQTLESDGYKVVNNLLHTND